MKDLFDKIKDFPMLLLAGHLCKIDCRDLAEKALLGKYNWWYRINGGRRISRF